MPLVMFFFGAFRPSSISWPTRLGIGFAGPLTISWNIPIRQMKWHVMSLRVGQIQKGSDVLDKRTSAQGGDRRIPGDSLVGELNGNKTVRILMECQFRENWLVLHADE